MKALPKALPWALLAALTILMATACSGGSGGSQTAESPEPGPPEREAFARPFLAAFNPLTMLGSLASGGAPSTEADEALKAALLEPGDLPDGFSSLGDFSLSMSSELGDIEMAARTMTPQDAERGEFGPLVVSAAASLPPRALAEIGDLRGLEALDEAELREMMGQAGPRMREMFSLQLLDASGLGDGGVGMRMEMDLAAMLEAMAESFGVPAGAERERPPGIVMEMYAFLRQERVLMVMVMWPEGSDPGIDSRALAETMDARAEEAF